jgi:hypothetical protein
MLLVHLTPDAMPDAEKVCRLLRYTLTCTRICVWVIALVEPDEESLQPSPRGTWLYSCLEKMKTGGQGGLAPWAASPSGGERGLHS